MKRGLQFLIRKNIGCVTHKSPGLHGMSLTVFHYKKVERLSMTFMQVLVSVVSK